MKKEISKAVYRILIILGLIFVVALLLIKLL
jgi:hypothetical protein